MDSHPQLWQQCHWEKNDEVEGVKVTPSNTLMPVLAKMFIFVVMKITAWQIAFLLHNIVP